jgi:uncharacterized protein YecE (DUF72 family)
VRVLPPTPACNDVTSAENDGILIAVSAKDSQLFLGTSSWTADGWVGTFYPEGTKPADFLQYYSRQFNCVEIDSTFYRIPTAKTVEQWRERTPNGFAFAAKAPSIITHQKVLVDADDDLKQFLRVMDLLGDKLGPIVWQFPYFRRGAFRGVAFFIERLEPWLKKLPKNHQWVVEVRNKGWLSEKLYSVLRRHGVALALIDHPWMPRPDEVFNTGDPATADFTYIRWLGDRKGIEERTMVWDSTIIDRTAELTEWVRVMRGLEARGIRIYAAANNHYGGFAPDTVNTFRRLWSATEAPKRKQPAEHFPTNMRFNF